MAEFVQAESLISLQHFSGRKTPLFLIHDGGGTTFTYHCLDSLGRFVFAIANPRWASGEPFKGGLAEMGALYAGLIRNTIAGPEFPVAARRRGGKVEILLGGWSLGGLLSLEVARQLADDARVKVTGVVMIDSAYVPKQGGGEGEGPGSVGFDTSEEGKSKNQILAQRAMTEARRMIPSWQVPTWQDTYHSLRPKMILLRAKEHVPASRGEEGKSMVDRFREDPQLGWGEHGADFVEEVVSIPGDHFSLATEPHIRDTSKALREACDTLDPARGGMRVY